MKNPSQVFVLLAVILSFEVFGIQEKMSWWFAHNNNLRKTLIEVIYYKISNEIHYRQNYAMINVHIVCKC